MNPSSRPLLRLLSPLVAVAVLGAVLAGCSGTVSGSGHPDPAALESAPSTDAPSTDSPDGNSPDDTPALPPGATPGLDDYNQDGEPDPTCGTHDYGAGLVLRLLCDNADAQPPAEGTTLVPDSLFAVPSPHLDLTGISGSDGVARDADGHLRVVLFISSDTLFATGSARLSDPARVNLDNIGALITKQFPGKPVAVRGHTDATGSPAANQRLSEQRATTTADYLSAHGIDRSLLTSAGLGQTVPIVAETDPDGGPNPAGQAYDRRVEVVITAS